MKYYKKWAGEASQAVKPSDRDIYVQGYVDGFKESRSKAAKMLTDIRAIDSTTKHILVNASVVVGAIGDGDYADSQPESL